MKADTDNLADAWPTLANVDNCWTKAGQHCTNLAESRIGVGVIVRFGSECCHCLLSAAYRAGQCLPHPGLIRTTWLHSVRFELGQGCFEASEPSLTQSKGVHTPKRFWDVKEFQLSLRARGRLSSVLPGDRCAAGWGGRLCRKKWERT